MQNPSFDAVSLTRSLISIESTDPGTYETEIGGFLFSLLSGLGVPVVKREVLPGRFNLMAKIAGESDEPDLVFICHMDTVPVGEGWTRSPFGAEMDSECIYGRGACDMKSGLACALSAFAWAAKEVRKGRKPKRSLVFIGTVDEEDFMRGAEAAVSDGWVAKDSLVLDTEPTKGHIQAAHKGRTWFEITVTGVTAHAATPWKGADAVAAMAEIISLIRQGIRDCPVHEDLGSSTVTFGRIEGGLRPYVVPECCKVWVDMRLAPPADTGFVEEMVKFSIKEGTLRVPGTQAEYRITGSRPVVEKEDGSLLLRELKEAVKEVTGEAAAVSVFPGYTDTAVIAAALGNGNCMSYGPGNLENAHKPEEFVLCEDIVRCEKVLTRLAAKLLFGKCC